MRLAGAVALITGASSGIGAATAVALARAGTRLILTGRDEQRLRSVAVRTGGLALPADLAEPDGPDRLIEAALAQAGRIDLLISNAGAGWAGPIGDLPRSKATELLTVNLLAPIQLARLVAPSMVERGFGRLIFVSSIAGITGVRHEAVYAATKAGLNYLAESLSYELAGTGAGVSVVLPGVVDTPFFGRRGQPYGRRLPAPIPPEQVARAIVTAAQRDLDVVFVPGWLRIPAWLHGTSPRTFRRLARRFG
ncbi:MAG TPA: SDR family NAD(P)-dependent oxidoreductase [Streptosporangiaceae bacterium]|jgi:short-subunit dehydrogenase